MGLINNLGKALKNVGDEIKKSDPGKHLKNVEQAPDKAGKDLSNEAGKGRAPKQSGSEPATTPSGKPVPRSPHPGYTKIAAWMKRNYKDRIAGAGESDQRSLQLEQLTAEACSGLSAKAKKGFMEYLKKQNYEPLLK
jgi:hypothetical protein